MSHFKRLLQYSKRYHWINTAGLVLAFAAILLGLAKPYITKRIVDDVLVHGQYEAFARLAFIFVALTLVRVVVQYGKTYIFESTSQKVLYDFRSDLYRGLLEQSFTFYDKVRTGLLMNRMVGDLQAVRHFLNTGYVQAFEAAVTLVFALILMLRLNVLLTVSLFLILPLLYISTRRMSKQLRPTFRRIRSSFEDLTSYVQENITGIGVVKAFGREEYEKDKFFQVAKGFTDNNLKASRIRSKYVPLGQFISNTGALLILLIGGFLVMKGQVTIGTLVAFYAYLLTLQHPINSVAGLVNQWENAQASLEKVFELMDEQPAVSNREDPIVLEHCTGWIEFDQVYFKYDEDYVLKDINFTVEPGTTTAILGDTGTGKSSIMRLIPRFYDCTKGRVLIDGYDVRDLELNSLRRRIGVVFQETFLFSDTIAANIAFANPNASQEEIEQAAQIAHAHEFIMETPYGYDTIIGERGMGLSGGQKQRIALARAILSDPDILILDDATSSVDMETEQAIQEAMDTVKTGRTTLIIAYRISSVKDADQILVLKNGTIYERGTHEALVAKRGKYYQTLLEQYSEYHEYDRTEGRGA